MSKTIVIVAGTGQAAKEFTVHTTYTTQSSSLIRASLSQDWKEGKEKRIASPEAEPESLEGYLSWVYSRTITLGSSQTQCMHCTARSIGGLCTPSTSKELAQMYVLGDYLGDLRFCNAVMDTWVVAAKAATCIPSPAAVCYVWQQTTAESPWRELYLLKWK